MNEQITSTMILSFGVILIALGIVLVALVAVAGNSVAAKTFVTPVGKAFGAFIEALTKRISDRKR